MKIGFIGAGKVGSAFGRYLKDRGFDVVGYFSSSRASAIEASKFTESECLELKEIVNICDYIFITTPDDVISIIWNELKSFNLQDKKIFHMSGSVSSTIFDGIDNYGAFGYSLHPLFPIPDRNVFNKLSSAAFTIEGFNTGLIEDFLTCSGIHYFEINGENKTKYHAAAVFASNYVVCVAKAAKELLRECEIPEDKINDALYPLLLGAVENMREKGIEGALTGPIVRGDTGTVKKHQNSLGRFRKLYDELGRIAVEISVEKGKLNKDSADELLDILGGGEIEENSFNI